MRHLTLSRLLAISASSLAITIAMSNATLAATINIGASTSNSGVINTPAQADTFDYYTFDINNGSFTNTGTITGRNTLTSNSLGRVLGTASASITGSSITNSGTIAVTGAGEAIGVTGGATITNNLGATISSTNNYFLIDAFYLGASGGATLNNAGTISSGGVTFYGAAGSNITNTGSMSSSAADVINIYSSGITGTSSITNSGTMASAARTIAVSGPFTTTINNQAGGVISSSSTVSSNATVSSGLIAGEGAAFTLTNAGTITSVGSFAVYGTSNVAGGYIATDHSFNVTNSGTISGNSAGIFIGNRYGEISNITNSGTIATTANINSATLFGTIYIGGAAAITNSGQINNAFGAEAIRIAGTVNLNSTINNQAAGSIRATGTSNAIRVDQAMAAITNAGTIQSTAGTAIALASTGRVTSGITNSATGNIIGGGGVAIDNSLSSNVLTIANAGSITGDIKLGTGADVVTVSGGTIAGNIVGAGSANVVNFTGTSAMNGNITGVNAVNITGGVLTLGGTITAPVTNSATLATTANRTITGNYNQTAAGTLQTAVSSRTTASLLTVSGTASLANNSTIKAQIANGVTLQVGDSFTVLTAGTLTASASSLIATSSDPFVTLTASTSGNSLLITTSAIAAPASGTSASAAAMAQVTSNLLTSAGFSSTTQLQQAAGGGTAGTNVGATLSSYVDLVSNLRGTDTTKYNTINNAFSALSGTEAVNALQTLQPTAAVTAGTTSASISAGTSAGNVILARLENGRNAETNLANAEIETGMSAGDKYSRNRKLWLQPYASSLAQDKKDGIDGYDADTVGLLMGADVNLNERTRAGIAFGYNRTNVDATGNSRGSGSDIDGYSAALYANYTRKNFYLDSLVGLQSNRYESKRFSTLFNDTAKASYDGVQYNARVSTGYDLRPTRRPLTITPNAAFNYTYLDQDGYTETGSVINNRVNSHNATAATSDVGLKISYPVKMVSGTITPQIRASWMHEFGDKSQSSTSSFVGSTTSFTTTGATIDDDALRLGGGLALLTTGKTKISLDGDYVMRDTSDALSGQLNVKLPF
jgi:outer membrane autotransporter protein